MPACVKHVPSYYAATRNVTSDYPPLRGAHRADVAIVGGGFTGVSTALHLAERGYDVALVEAHRIGWGASGRNGGQLIDGFVDDDKAARYLGNDADSLAWQMRLESRDIVVERIEKHAIDCDLRFGFLYLAQRPAERRLFETSCADLRRRDYPHELRLLEQADLGRYLVSDRYIGGLYNGGNGHLHPLNLCAGEARAAADLGASIFEQSHVTRIRHADEPVVETEHGSVRAKQVVLAGNAYLGATEPALRGHVIPAGSYMVATAPLPRETVASLLRGDNAYCEYCVGLNYFRLSTDRRLLFGGMCTYSGRDPKDIAAALRPRLRRVFPDLGAVPFDFEWGGKIAISINRVPQFGRINGNIYYAQGYSGHGVAPTHLAGKMLADAIAGDAERFDVFARVRHWRLPGGRWFANPALALGMLYYRLREIL